MEPLERPSSRRRESTLTLVLVLLLGGILLFFLDLISLGVFRWVFVAILGIGLLGCLHYLLWGQALSEEVAGEREEEEVRRRSEEDF